MRLRIAANRATCEGAGFCEQVAPRLFAVGPDGAVRALTDAVSDVDADAALGAEGMCPTRSIRTAVED